MYSSYSRNLGVGNIKTVNSKKDADRSVGLLPLVKVLLDWQGLYTRFLKKQALFLSTLALRYLKGHLTRTRRERRACSIVRN